MSSSAERQACADNNMLHYVAGVSEAIHAVVPDVLVTVGMFTFSAVGKAGPNGLRHVSGDNRYPFRPLVLLTAATAQSGLGFVDVHVYPVGGSWAMAPDLASSELLPNRTATKGGPALFMGETGAFTSFFASATAAAPYFATLLHDSCSWLFCGACMCGEGGGCGWGMGDGGGRWPCARCFACAH